jgi:hypothetical protein
MRGLLLPAHHGEERPHVGIFLSLPGRLLQQGGAEHLGEMRPFGQLLEVIDLEGCRERGTQLGVVLLVGLRLRGPRRSSGLVDVEPAEAAEVRARASGVGVGTGVDRDRPPPSPH